MLDKYDFSPPLLDVGCGAGELLNLIQARFDWKKLQGSDISEKSVGLTEEKGFGATQLDLSEPPAKEMQNKFNSVVCSEVLEHLPDDLQALNNLRKMLKKGGHIIITVPHNDRYWRKHDENSGHLRRYKKKELKTKTVSAGFEIKEILVWGAFIYRLYYFLLDRISPAKLTKINSGPPGTIKKTACKVLYWLFFIDDLFLFTSKGPRLFMVCEKKQD